MEMTLLSAPVMGFVLSLVESTKDPNYSILVFSVISAFTVVFPIVIGLLGYRMLNRGQIYFFYLLVLGLMVDIAGYNLSLESANTVLYNMYSIVEYTLLMLMFRAWETRDFLRRLYYFSIPVFVSVSAGLLIVALTVKEVEYESILLAIESIIFVVVSVITLLREMRDSSVLLVDNPTFWIVSGVLVYFAGNVFVFSLLEAVLAEGTAKMQSAWLIHGTLTVSKNVLFSLGFLSTGGPKDGLKRIWRKIRGVRTIEQA